MSDTALVPVRVDTTELSIRPGLLRELAILLDRHTETWENGGDGSVVPTDPSEFDSYLGLDGVIYHGFGEPDIEATAEAAAEDGPDDEGLH
ncbi:hypothetical protein [Streptomyces mirabilis]|uniref:hypothetical protein n=1 Tax=Streptomyces mirabilis TaxID=68239 RepID=UPI0033E57089